MTDFQSIRNLVLFFGGLGGLAHQTLIAPEAQPVLVGAFLVMMGLAPALHLDEKRK